ncbi:hypothetical protein K491DRAFT_672861 [Lophiostoma macrostomum CBS 122681]|uniref:Uncharacterized protein n=1 Tax=Lophiostoma macrostomum CBS 122681 TaxID=1314788 RepID=A0A6A6TSJ6_9PLEO|nr:hypothetical protein K491DRAFT_672861 [Lophiostoma macrostomum CBS 122681]
MPRDPHGSWEESDADVSNLSCAVSVPLSLAQAVLKRFEGPTGGNGIHVHPKAGTGNGNLRSWVPVVCAFSLIAETETLKHGTWAGCVPGLGGGRQGSWSAQPASGVVDFGSREGLWHDTVEHAAMVGEGEKGSGYCGRGSSEGRICPWDMTETALHVAARDSKFDVRRSTPVKAPSGTNEAGVVCLTCPYFPTSVSVVLCRLALTTSRLKRSVAMRIGVGVLTRRCVQNSNE